MMRSAVRIWVAMSVSIFAGCNSIHHGGSSEIAGHSGGGSQGNAGGTAAFSGGGGSVGSGGTIDSVGTMASGGKAGLGGNASNGGNTANGGTQRGDASSEAAIDAAACPICPPMKCAYGSPVDDDGCTVCTCNPAPNGRIDGPADSFCALAEGCVDADNDTGTPAEAGDRSDGPPVDAGIKCGTAVCTIGQYCCNPVMDICAPMGAGCVF